MYLQSCTTIKVPKYVGEYQLDLINSKLGNYAIIDSIKDLKLTISKDSTFHFSKNAPFIFRQNGTWRMHRFEALDHPPKDECYFNYGGNNREDLLVPMDDGVLAFFFNFPLSKEDYEQVQLLQFKRIK